MSARKPQIGAFRFQTFRIEHLASPDCDPNSWLINRDGPDYITVETPDGKLIDELDVKNFSLLDDLSLICYAIGWLHASVQAEVV